MTIQMSADWQEKLEQELSHDYFKKLVATITVAYQTTTTFPQLSLIFNAFEACSFAAVKVVILGQDPYHSHGQAQGLAFSVPDTIAIPPSLKNIFKEISCDLNSTQHTSGNLEHWSKQGILLLNSTLTVEANKAGSHQGLGWERFSDAVIKKISTEKERVVFLLWGNSAISKRSLIDESKHLVLVAPHPSPLAAYRGFFGCRHFSKTNSYLTLHGLNPIIW